MKSKTTRRFFVPRVEVLENRLAPTAYHVTMTDNANLADGNDGSGNSGSLRYIIDTRLNQNGQARNSIDFPNLSGTINLASALQQITKNVEIVGPGPARLTIAGDLNAQYRIF